MVSHGMGRTTYPFQPKIHLSMYGFQFPRRGDEAEGQELGNAWVNETKVPAEIFEGASTQNTLKVDYYAHFPLGTDIEGPRTDLGATDDFYLNPTPTASCTPTPSPTPTPTP